jgi:hypothetical protein
MGVGFYAIDCSQPVWRHLNRPAERARRAICRHAIISPLEGQVIRVGGKDETVPVHLRDGAIIHSGLNTTPELARRIAQHLLGPTLRVFGTGTWFRGGDGCWQLRSFRITDFAVLDEAPLSDVVKALRRVEGSGWGEVPDPVRALLEERHGHGGTT